MIRLAIAEEHKIVRWALREAFATIPDFQVVAEAGTADETIAAIRHAKPDVLLLDMTLPETGFDVLRALRELDDAPLVVMLAPRVEPTYGVRAMKAGAHGFVGKSSEPKELLDAIRAVSRGERVVPPEVEALLAAGDGHPASALSKRELEVMEMIARGMTNREIAEHLGISIKTIDTHRGHMLKKLQLRNNADVTRFALRHGYVSA
jgi:two-component system, NarL family, invasion response regulator UvrY